MSSSFGEPVSDNRSLALYVPRLSFLGNRSTSIEVFPGKQLGVHCYGESMNAEPLIAEIAGLVGEPARATMLSTLLAMAELSPIPRTVAS
jgi:hypothetical protein